MEIIIARNSGYCYGVKRALDIVESTLEKNKSSGKKVYSIGEIIHNNNVVKGLEEKGLELVDEKGSIEKGNIFIIRSHGISPEIVRGLKKKDIEVVDATCPFVKRAQIKAKKMAEDGYFIVLVGTKTHPEVIGIRESADTDEILVVQSPEDIEGLKRKKKIGVVVQTTQTMERFRGIIDAIIEKADTLLIENTICNTTSIRQSSTAKIAKDTELMLIVGGKNSANTTHLAEISRKINKNTYHIENYKEIDTKWLEGKNTIGISGGASTPIKDIEDVADFVRRYYNVG